MQANLSVCAFLHLFSIAIIFGQIHCAPVEKPETTNPIISNPVEKLFANKSCDEDQRPVQWALEKFNTTKVAACQQQECGRLYVSALGFVPSEDIDEVGVRILVTTEDDEPELFAEEELSHVKAIAGTPTIVTDLREFPTKPEGKKATVQYIIYNDETGDTEACAELNLDLLE